MRVPAIWLNGPNPFVYFDSTPYLNLPLYRQVPAIWLNDPYLFVYFDTTLYLNLTL